jgi:CheY-like chemotaxis protein
MERAGYILMADDSENDLELARRAFADHKITNEFIVVHNGAKALDFLYRRGKYKDRLNEDPIFVMLDVNMPLVNGIEVLTEMKADSRLCHIPVVMLTSSRHGPDVEECYRQRANAYVVKPVDFKQFDEAIRTIGKFWVVLNEAPPVKLQTL